ncbi:MAG: hypothetical protein V3R31_02220, partial [Candidatus Humimicrobiaceae bacterium]
KEMLQQSIARLKEDYDNFKGQISKFADDFKQKTLSIGDIQLNDTLKEIDSASEKIGIDELTDIIVQEEGKKSGTLQDATSPEESGMENSFPEDKVEFKHAKKEFIEESEINEEDKEQEATLSDDIIEELNYQGNVDLEEDKEKDPEESDSPDIEGEKADIEDNDEENGKKTRKKIDIANPDIINDFFKTDED